jgi:phosphopantetheinyl transferase (holo-ACP synthase)
VNTAKTKLERLQAKEQAADEQILKQRLERKYLERMKEVGESAAALWAAQNALAKAQMRHEAALEALEPYDMEIATA